MASTEVRVRSTIIKQHAAPEEGAETLCFLGRNQVPKKDIQKFMDVYDADEVTDRFSYFHCAR